MRSELDLEGLTDGVDAYDAVGSSPMSSVTLVLTVVLGTEYCLKLPLD